MVKKCYCPKKGQISGGKRKYSEYIILRMKEDNDHRNFSFLILDEVIWVAWLMKETPNSRLDYIYFSWKEKHRS